MRTPISRERAETVNASNPWMPIAASRNATAANAPSTRSCTTRGAVSSDDDLLERLHARDRQLRIGARDDRRARPESASPAARSNGSPDPSAHRTASCAVALLRCRHVDLRLALRARGRAPGCRRPRRRSVRTANATANCWPIGSWSGKCCRANDSADDRHARRVERIAGADIAALAASACRWLRRIRA